MLSNSFQSESGEKWYALHVRSRHEKAVSAALRNKGFEEFLPLYSSRRQWSQRIAEVEVPLFPGYVFCRFDPNVRKIPISTTPGVMEIIGFGGKPVAVDQAEIESIHRVMELGIAAEPWKYTPVGQKVRIEHGPFTGLKGVLLSARKKHRLLLSLNLLKRSVSIQIDDVSVVAISDSGLRKPVGSSACLQRRGV